MAVRGKGFVALGRVGTRKAMMVGWNWHEEGDNGGMRRSRGGEGEVNLGKLRKPKL